MPNSETSILRSILLESSKIPGVVLWRNHIGHDGRAHVNYGIQNPGGADLIGWRVRDGVAVFLAIEVKIPGGRRTPEQENFIATVRNSGGLAGFASSIEEAKDIIG